MQRDTALAAIPGSIGRRIPPQSTRRLHADDIGTLISQQHARKRSCDILAKIDDPNAVEYTGHTFPPLHEVPSHPGRGHGTYILCDKGCELHLAPRSLEDTRFFHHCLLHRLSPASPYPDLVIVLCKGSGSRILRQWNDECFAATDGQGKML